jgi:hypothetical protein
VTDRPRHYVLDEEWNIVAVDDVVAWARWFETSDERRKIAHTQVSPEVAVSTVFLSADHNFSGEGPPVLFETMVFGGPLDQEQERYTTWAAATAGHIRWVERASLGA